MDCRGVRPLLRDLLGQFCFNFVGKFGGWELARLEDVTENEEEAK